MTSPGWTPTVDPRTPLDDGGVPAPQVEQATSGARPEPGRPAAVAAAVPTAVPVTCPSCGRPSVVDPGARTASAFCPSCDYPLFWARERVVAAAGTEMSDEGLRRLPGMAGRVTLASFPCPVCHEPNSVTGVHCTRCGSELRPAPVAPAPVVLPPPPPVLVQADPIPETGVPWWLWVALGVGVVLVVTLLLVYLFA